MGEIISLALPALPLPVLTARFLPFYTWLLNEAHRHTSLAVFSCHVGRLSCSLERAISHRGLSIAHHGALKRLVLFSLCSTKATQISHPGNQLIPFTVPSFLSSRPDGPKGKTAAASVSFSTPDLPGALTQAPSNKPPAAGAGPAPDQEQQTSTSPFMRRTRRLSRPIASLWAQKSAQSENDDRNQSQSQSQSQSESQTAPSSPPYDAEPLVVPELEPVFAYLNNQANKLYQEGYFLKLNDLDTRMLFIFPPPPNYKGLVN